MLRARSVTVTQRGRVSAAKPASDPLMWRGGHPSPTRRTLTPADIESLTRASFDDGTRVVDCGPLSGGGFAAVWWVRLGDGRTVVLKTSPPAHVTLLAGTSPERRARAAMSVGR